MAKARIVYEVDSKQLDALKKKLKELQEAGEDVTKPFDELEPKTKKVSAGLGDLKGQLTGLVTIGAAAALAKQFADLVVEVNKSRKEVALLTNQTGKALDQITAKIRATSQTFGKDFNEVLQAANTLSKEFGTSLPEAIDNVNEGFIRGLDINGEYLSTLREYSTFIKEAGLNQEQFNVLIQKQVTQGIYSDKGIDAIKEAVISIREMTPATRDAIRAVGINTDELIKDIQSGTTTYFEAVQQIAARTREISDPRKTGAILADVFRGAGEDAGNFIFTLGDVQKGYAEAGAEQSKYIERQRELLKTSEDLNSELVSFSRNFSSVGSSIKVVTNQIATATLGVLNDMVSLFIDMDTEMGAFKDGIESLEIAQLESELARLNKELEDSGGFFDSLLGPGATAEKRARLAGEIALVNTRIEELKNNEKDLNKELDKEANIRENILTPAIEKENKARKDNSDEIERAKQVSQLESEMNAEQKINEQKIQAIFDQIEAEQELNDSIEEINNTRRKNELEAEREAQLEKRELIQQSAQDFLDILDGFNQLRIQQIEQEIAANELARNRELEAARGNKEQEAQINKKFDEEQSKLKRKQANSEKQNALFGIAVNTALAVAKAWGQTGIFGVAAQIPILAMGAVQAALVAAQPIPKFAKGVIDLQGPGTETSDSIPALLSRRESVMTAEETKQYNATLKAIRHRKVKPEVLNKFVLQGKQEPVIIDNYDKLAEAILKQPQNHTYVDENGFTGYMYRGVNARQVKQSRFRM